MRWRRGALRDTGNQLPVASAFLDIVEIDVVAITSPRYTYIHGAVWNIIINGYFLGVCYDIRRIIIPGWAIDRYFILSSR